MKTILVLCGQLALHHGPCAVSELETLPQYHMFLKKPKNSIAYVSTATDVRFSSTCHWFKVAWGGIKRALHGSVILNGSCSFTKW